MKKRILSVLLVVILVLSLMPITALADNEIISWSGLQEAINSASTDDTITLTQNLTALDGNNSIEIPTGKNITLDLAGFELNGNSKVGSVIIIEAGGNLTITDSRPTEEHMGYVDENGLWHPGASVPNGCTAKTIKGGIITGGKGTNIGDELVGGGVYVAHVDTFVMNGGTITGCESTKGGGVFTWGTFTMNNNSAIGNCTAAIDGGGVCACNCSFVMNGNSKVSECTADNGGGGVYIWAAADMTASFIMNDNSMISDCNAYVTDTSNYRSGGGVCVEGNNCTFTMNGGSICENNGVARPSDGCGGSVNVYSGTFIMKSGIIKDNTATSYCAGVFVNNDATFTMAGDSIISGNTGKQGAGVYSKGTFTMSENSMITKNTGTNGGGVYVESGNFVMEGSSQISYNKGNTGGGVCVYGGSFTMTGSSRIDHNTGTNAGGVLANVNIILGGDAKITNNVINGTIKDGELTGGIANNVYLYTNKYITLGDGKPASSGGNGVDKPKDNFKVGVTTATSPDGNNSIPFTTNGKEDDVKYFFSDDTKYEVKHNTDHLELIVHNHTIEKVTGQAPTETASGWKDYYECTYCHKCFEDSNGVNEISNIDEWKAEGGNGYIAPLVHKTELIKGKEATYTEAGYKSYYVCKNCGKYYEDAKGLVEISDIDKWKAKGGKGYLPKLEKDPDSPQTGDPNHMNLWLTLLMLSYAGLFVFVIYEKIKNE